MAEPAEPNHRQRKILLGGTSFLGALLLTLLWPWAPRVEQPIQYNHQKHLNAGLECDNCHTQYSSTPYAGLPTIEVCGMCHTEPSTGTAEETKIVELVKQGEPLHWKQINQLPTHVYFSHQTHVAAAGIECAACHGDMKQRTVPPTEPYFAWDMDSCISCHAQRAATVDCNGCHR